MSDTEPSLAERNVDEAVACYFSTVHVEMISIVQGFALFMLISQNVSQVPSFGNLDWAYFFRGLTVFLLAIALWHAYVTQLAYVATLHWLHTLFPFLFGVLQFMLANPKVLNPRTGQPNLSDFIYLMALTALTGGAAYFNTWFQHGTNRTKMRFLQSFGKDAQQLHTFWGNLYIFFSVFMVVVSLVFFGLGRWAEWSYKPSEEIRFPIATALFAALAIFVDPRFCATHRWARPKAVRDIYKKLYSRSIEWNELGAGGGATFIPPATPPSSPLVP